MGIFKPGRYSGFDAMSTVSGLIVRISHTAAIKKTLENGSQVNNFGSFITPTGTIIHEDSSIDLTIASNVGNSNTRIDYVVAEHVYSTVQGGVVATYFILQGPANGSEPVLGDDSIQCKLAKITITPGGTTFGNLTLIPLQPPFLGSTTAQQVYNQIKALILPDINISSDIINGLIMLASVAEVLAGEENTKAVTSYTLQEKFNALPTAEVVPDASTTTKGRIEIATQAEVNALTDTLRAVVPATLSGAINSAVAEAIAALDLNYLREVNYGTFNPADIDTPSVGYSAPVSGDIVSAVVSAVTSEGDIYNIIFANPMVDSNYQIKIDIESLANIDNDNEIKTIIWKKISTTQIQVFIEEASGAAQNLKIHIQALNNR